MKHILYFLAHHLVILPAILVGYVIADVEGEQDKLTTFVSFAVLMLISMSVGFIIKHIVRKKRPPLSIEMFKPRGKYAFPSGHALNTATVSAFIYLQNHTLGLISFLCAIIISLARVKSHVHDKADVLWGFIFGTLIGFACTSFIIKMVITFLIVYNTGSVIY